MRRQFGPKVFATGIGVTPLQFNGSESPAALREALAEFALFECRDCHGFDRIFGVTNGSAEVVNGVDDSYLVKPVSSVVGDGARRLHLSFVRQAIPDRGIYDEIRSFAENFDEVKYWNCVPTFNDLNLNELAKLLPKMQVLDCHDLVHAPIPVAPGDFMITQRFHPHLVAARLGCSGVFLHESKYYFDKHQSVVHLGSSFTKYVPGGLTFPLDPRTGQLLERDAETMARKARVRDLCYGAAA